MSVDEIAPGEVHLWRARSAAIAGPLWGDCLDPAERQRTLRLLIPAQRQAFAFARTMLRVVLGAYLLVDPIQLRFATRSGGKPYLPGQRLMFSLSHSADGVLLALVPGNDVGVDLEAIDRKLDTDALAGASLSDADRCVISTMDPSGRRRAILRMWTRKEALLKAEGSGLACDPRDLTLPVEEPLMAARIYHRSRIWTLIDLPLGEAWQASLAVEGGIGVVRGYCLGW